MAARPLLLILAVAVLASQAASLPCLDNDGKEVAWWFMMKLPNTFEFAYSDENYKPSKPTQLEIYPTLMNNTTHPVALTRTLQSLLSSRGETRSTESFLMYNDQPDEGNPGTAYGHTKGVFAPGSFYLLHSTPHFPSSSGKSDFYFPESETTYGQTFLCVTLTKDSDTDTIAKHLLYTKPYVYYDNIPSSVTSAHPDLKKVLDKDWVDDAGTVTGSVSGTSKGFTFFGKNAAWDDDLYEGLVAPGLKADLIVESWLRGSKEGSYCKPKHKYQVVDVLTMAVTDLEGQQQTWKETQDHAKWAITTDGSNMLCIADINRMTTQRNRGGGAVCFYHKGLSGALHSSVASANTCKKHLRHHKKHAHAEVA